LGEKAAIDFADNTVVRSQGSAAAMDRPLAQHSDLGRFALLFETFNLNQLGQLLQDIGGIGYKTSNKFERFKMGMRLLAGTAAMGAVYDAIGMPSPMPIWEAAKEAISGLSEGEYLKGFGRTAKELTGLFPLIGSTRYGTGDILGAGPGMVRKGAETFYKGLEKIGTGETSDIIRNLLSPIGQLKGIPGTMPLTRLSEYPGKRTLGEALVGKGEPEPSAKHKPFRRPSKKQAESGESLMLDPLEQMLWFLGGQ
jgi:hypothetical protein